MSPSRTKTRVCCQFDTLQLTRQLILYLPTEALLTLHTIDGKRITTLLGARTVLGDPPNVADGYSRGTYFAYDPEIHYSGDGPNKIVAIVLVSRPPMPRCLTVSHSNRMDHSIFRTRLKYLSSILRTHAARAHSRAGGRHVHARAVAAAAAEGCGTWMSIIRHIKVEWYQCR